MQHIKDQPNLPDLVEGFGEKIKRARLRKGKTQEELAALLGTTKATISRYESGKREVSIDTAQQIADALGISWFELHMGISFDDYIRIRSEAIISQSCIIESTESAPLHQLIVTFKKLNEAGQQKAIERVEELTEISKYLACKEE